MVELDQAKITFGDPQYTTRRARMDGIIRILRFTDKMDKKNRYLIETESRRRPKIEDELAHPWGKDIEAAWETVTQEAPKVVDDKNKPEIITQEQLAAFVKDGYTQ